MAANKEKNVLFVDLGVVFQTLRCSLKLIFSPFITATILELYQPGFVLEQKMIINWLPVELERARICRASSPLFY